MRLRIFFVALAAVALAPISVLANDPPAPFIASIDGTTVTASGVTPQGKVVLCVISREQKGVGTTNLRRDRLSIDSDGDGIITFDLGEEVAHRSIVAAVDIESGVAFIVTPTGYPLRSKPLDVRGLRRLNGVVRELTYGLAFLEVLVVRPRTGAWKASVGDGSQLDADGEDNGLVTIDPEQLRAIGDSPAAPDRFLPKDVVIVIDPYELTAYMTEVSQ